MNRIEQIRDNVKNVTDWYADNGLFVEDIEYLLNEVERLNSEINKAKDKSQIFASHCAVQLDRHGTIHTQTAFEKTQEIYDMLCKALEPTPE